MSEKVFLDLFEKALDTMQRTACSTPHHTNLRIQHAILGIADEAGELVQTLKAKVYYDKEYDLLNHIEELGDLLWYYMMFIDELSVIFKTTPLEIFTRIVDVNRIKLSHRYNNGQYSSEQAIKRDKVAERIAMEACVQDLFKRKVGNNGKEQKESIKTKVKKKSHKTRNEER